MAKKKSKKKAILKRISTKRGERGRRKKETKGRNRGEVSKELRERAENAYHDSVLLAQKEEFSSIHFDQDLLSRFLKNIIKRGEEDPKIFIKEGINEISTISFLEEIKVQLNIYSQKKNDEERVWAITARFVLGWLNQGLPPSEIPFFHSIFLRDVKANPLSESGHIWKLLKPFLPTRILSSESTLTKPGATGLITDPLSPPKESERPEDEKEEKDDRYPHIILPK
jgi:hypothetical protein